jgi:hypothetical protein
MKFIFEVHIKPGHSAEQYAATWVRVSDILQQSPGAPQHLPRSAGPCGSASQWSGVRCSERIA